ncbi:MAG: 3-methyl-2-oxobutanoate hydroxymethyltransferase, 3-methyl-2-oxobutanoate hydroxymethyltransferase [candidate division NC10 bacterium CSP1-5]|nr:MAG: 3-methyl-2-oxobutanoate hydroxymethyltransferase, 3-methyl-2-oxobutanoate hydroxymethyltransferase [candidate division NC10 bacterium CSP1-5]
MATARVTTVTLREMKDRSERISMLTAYDYPIARLLDEAGIEVILVGDSLAMVGLGYETTLPVTMEEMLHHVRAVSRGVKRALLVADMPFGSFQASVEDGVRNAGRFLKEAGAQAVKLEGGREVADLTRRLTSVGIPVMGHLGLTPQMVHQFGGFKVQGRTAAAAERLREDALLLEEAGVFALVLEGIPWQVAEVITTELRIPTIGIGAGSSCDGQVLVTNDLLGLFDDFTPKFVKRYANLKETIAAAFTRYRQEVKAGEYPGPEHAFRLDDGEVRRWQEQLDRRRRQVKTLGRG